MSTYVLCSLEDMISLAQVVQSRVYWGSRFTIKGEDEEISWSIFWEILEDKVEYDRCKRVVINDDTGEVEFVL